MSDVYDWWSRHLRTLGLLYASERADQVVVERSREGDRPVLAGQEIRRRLAVRRTARDREEVTLVEAVDRFGEPRRSS
jgi:hypothetical protein